MAYTPSISDTFGDLGVYKRKTEAIFIQDWSQSLDLETSSTYKHIGTHILHVRLRENCNLKLNKAESALVESTNKGNSDLLRNAVLRMLA